MLLTLLCTVVLAAPAPDFLDWSARQPRPMNLPEEAGGYAFAQQHFERIAACIQERPGVVRPEVIGTTWADRPIWAFHIARAEEQAHWNELDQVLIFAGMHALEWISTEVAVSSLEALVDIVPPGKGVTVVPLLNPDGRAKVEADLLEGRRIYRRGNQRNVDLNRNFAVNREARSVWKAILPGYYSTTKAALSEPESQALDHLVERNAYSRSASLHAFGGYFYYPWSGLHERPPRADRDAFLQVGRAMERAQGAHAYRTRQLGRWGFFFRAHGTEIDHLYGEHGVQAWLVELTRSGLGPKTLGTFFRWYNPPRRAYHTTQGRRAMVALVFAQ